MLRCYIYFSTFNEAGRREKDSSQCASFKTLVRRHADSMTNAENMREDE